MLIAIMADTFGKITEVKDQSALREKIDILADYQWLISGLVDNREIKYIYAMRPKDAAEEEENSWQGTVSTIKKTIDRSMKE